MPIITFITDDDVKNEIDVNDVQTYLDELPPENIKIINVSNCELTILSNLARFTNLWKLHCSFNKLTTLPKFPNSLRELKCSKNGIISLPVLPDSLEYLHCSQNELTSLPTLPESLEWLVCENNQLTTLPELPDSLKYLHCKNNRLASLPALPEILEELDCGNNQLTTLPVLPESLVWLGCEYNQLTTLPELPDSLGNLEYFDNPIWYIIWDLVDDNDISIVRRTINTLNRFRHLYYHLKFKLKFIQWFLRANERKIMEQNHPDKITALLASGVDVLEL